MSDINNPKDSSSEHLKNLSEIRSLMERSSSFISLSGLSGVSAGVMGLLAAYLLNSRLKPFLDRSIDYEMSGVTRVDLVMYGIWV